MAMNRGGRGDIVPVDFCVVTIHVIRLTVGVIIVVVFPISSWVQGPPLELAGSSARCLCLACASFQYRAKGARFASFCGVLLLVPSALNLGLWRLSLRSPSERGGEAAQR